MINIIFTKKCFLRWSSLHNIIFYSFGLFFLLWSLLAQAQLSFRVIIVVQKNAGSTQNDFCYQQCNFAERERWMPFFPSRHLSFLLTGSAPTYSPPTPLLSPHFHCTHYDVTIALFCRRSKFKKADVYYSGKNGLLTEIKYLAAMFEKVPGPGLQTCTSCQTPTRCPSSRGRPFSTDCPSGPCTTARSYL